VSRTKHASFVKPLGYYQRCTHCDAEWPARKLRDMGRDEFGPLFRCRPCDTDNGDDWHGNERWNADGTPR
jgi:hypothetical protein